uniref:ATP synthase subunit 8 n=1 Tax=Holothuria spinifera TaxID=864314 RepID=A0A7U1ARH9_9ECHN|nr:ATP synthase subunit 8 [Holothuria spinifera]
MPQLDLIWFLFNFLIAWTLVLFVLSLLSNQNWNEQVSSQGETTAKPVTNKNWLW